MSVHDDVARIAVRTRDARATFSHEWVNIVQVPSRNGVTATSAAAASPPTPREDDR